MGAMVFLHRISGILFYLFGSSFFAAYLLLQNEIGGGWPLWWLEVWDIPLLTVAFLYGGLSLYRSITHKARGTMFLKLLIIVPLSALYIFLLVLNYWYHVKAIFS